MGLGFGLGFFYVIWGVVVLAPAAILSLLLRLAVDVARDVRVRTYR